METTRGRISFTFDPRDMLLSFQIGFIVSLMASFVLFFFPLDVLDEIWDLIESVSEGFLTYSNFSFVRAAVACVVL